MPIEVKPTSAFVVPLPGRSFAVPSRFKASAEHVTLEPRFDPDADGDYDIELDVEVDEGGRPRCVGLAVRAHDGAEAITGELLRRLPIAWMVRDATARAGSWLSYERRTPGGGARFELLPAVEQRQSAYAHFAENARRPRSGSRLIDADLEPVRDIYRAALERGDHPTEAVAKGMNVSRATAGRWVAKARERGLLGPARPRRAGEASR